MTGFERKSSVPASTARSMSPSSFRAVTIRTMIRFVSGSLLSCSQTSNPLNLGIITSSRIRSGLKRGDLVERILAVDGDLDFAIEIGQIGFEQFDIRPHCRRRSGFGFSRA